MHPQFLHRTSHLRQALFIHLLPFFHCHKEMTPPIAVQSAEQSLGLDHFPQSHHHRSCGFFLHHLRVINLAAGIVQNHKQVIPPIIVEPLMLAAVNVQQHSRHPPPRPSSPVRPRLCRLATSPAPCSAFCTQV